MMSPTPAQIEDVYDPLALFRNRLAEEHRERVTTLFEELVARAKIDEAVNQQAVQQITQLQAVIKQTSSSNKRWKRVRLILWLGVVLAISVLLLYLLPYLWQDISLPFSLPPLLTVSSLLYTTAASLINMRKLNPIIRKLVKKVDELNQSLAVRVDQAWQQMAPLNRLYDCSIAPTLAAQSVPRLEFDPWFTCGRLDELRNTFGLSTAFNQNKSILFSESGVINGNPFVVAESLDFDMGSKTYTGTLSISWQEPVISTDSKGRPQTRWVTRYQTLHAAVTKPKPEHVTNKFIIYGNEAAPNLHFSRTPSDLAHRGTGLRDKWRKKREMKKLEAFSRNLDDEYGYTMMSNREFELLFHATDRSNEVEFRLLFTPLAQSQMVSLLKDRDTGYGDNFTFIKSGMINSIYPAHLRTINLNTPPEYFHDYNLQAARQRFNTYHNEYFKALFFAMAPLLSIPIYQHHRSYHDIYLDIESRAPSFWSHEMVANHHGYQHFAHHDSITPSILKTKSTPSHNSTQQVEITAHGFRGVDRVEYVLKWGGDGRQHRVPVKWIEYIPVQRTSKMMVCEARGMTRSELSQPDNIPLELQELCSQWQITPEQTTLRHSLLSWLNS